MRVLCVIRAIILIVIIVGAIGAFAIYDMLNPISDEEIEQMNKEACLGNSCDMKKLMKIAKK